MIPTRRVVLFVLVGSLAAASTLVRDIRFSPSQFHTEFAACSLQVAGGSQKYDRVLGEDMDVTDEPGAPQLPVQPLVIGLNGHCLVTSVTFEVEGWHALDGKFKVFPCQKQQVLMQGTGFGGRGSGTVEATQPNPAIYQSHVPYPASPARWTGTSYRHDSTFVQVLVYPVRYVGAEQRLEVCGKVKAKVEVEGQTKSEARSQKLEDRSPDAVSGQRLAVGAFEYVIVTGQALDTVFQRLADWKTQKGVPAVVRTVDWIYTAYPGRDQAEQLRNYLKTLPDSGVKYVLLGGDVGVVPFRKAFAMNCQWGAMVREDSLPCDLYFADLDGTWDANNNNVFGEVDDSVDLYADLSVGRAPVNDMTQAQTFVRKVLGYEHGAVTGYQDKVLFFAEILWQNPYTDQGVHKNKMEQQSFASGYNVTKLYQSLGNETRVSVMQAMRDSQGLMNHDGHGWIDVMECGGSANRMWLADADTITNTALGVLYSIGCWTTAFDTTSIGEAFVTNPNGGTVATIGNSSYGWGSPGNPGFGYSDKYDNHFWHAITSEGLYHIGDALAAAKAYYVPFSRDKNVYRWHQYEVNLMGDPEMPVWTAVPESLAVTTPLSLGLGSGRYLFTVTRAGAPVPGTLVCLAKSGEVYSRGRTDDAGQAWLDAAPQTPGWLDLTVTARNCLPYVSQMACDTGGQVNFAGWSVKDDSAGNGDGIANPGETFRVPVWLENSGDKVSDPMTVKLHSDSLDATVLDSTATIGSINPGDSVLLDSFRVQLSATAYDGEQVRFELSLSAGCVMDVFFPVLQVGAPRIGFDRCWLTHAPLVPGSSGGLELRLQNAGHGFGYGTWCRLVSLDSLVSVPKDSAAFGDLRPLGFGTSTDSFVVHASASSPTGHTAQLELQVHADGYAATDTFSLLVGDYGFSDDMESGEAKWTHGGTDDLWHTTTYRSHSGSHSWYCGNDSTHQYNSGMDAWLTTAPFPVVENCTLRFWRWFKVPNYGVDGIHTIVVHGATEETLDFVGTGGALGDSAFANESQWAEEAYALSGVGIGDTIQVKIAFTSDGDTVDEGFYIDDVSVTGGNAPPAFVVESPVQVPPSLMLSVRPSLFRRTTTIHLAGPRGAALSSVTVYDASGRLVRRLPLVWRTTWDGRDANGHQLSAGAYFIEARTQTERRQVKVLLTR